MAYLRSRYYRIDIYNSSLVRIAEISDYLEMVFTVRDYAPGEAQITLPYNHAAFALLTNNCIIDILTPNFNSSPGGVWASVFTGVYRSSDFIREKPGYTIISVRGLKDILRDRIVAYPPGTVNRSLFIDKSPSFILHSLVKYNATSSGSVVDGRTRLATIPNFASVTVPSSIGTTIDYFECAEQNLLDVMLEISETHARSFDIRFAGGEFLYTQYSVFAAYEYLIVDTDRGNAASITQTFDRMEESTVAIIGSTGEATLKNYDVVTSALYDINTNNRELYVNANIDDVDEILSEGARALDKVKYKDKISVEIIDDLFADSIALGTAILVRSNNVIYTTKPIEITTSISSRNPTKQIVLEIYGVYA